MERVVFSATRDRRAYEKSSTSRPGCHRRCCSHRNVHGATESPPSYLSRNFTIVAKAIAITPDKVHRRAVRVEYSMWASSRTASAVWVAVAASGCWIAIPRRTFTAGALGYCLLSQTTPSPSSKTIDSVGRSNRGRKTLPGSNSTFIQSGSCPADATSVSNTQSSRKMRREIPCSLSLLKAFP